MACRLRGQELCLPSAVSQARPALEQYHDRSVAIGIRPEHLSVTAADGPSLKATVLRSEMLGAERLLHVSVDANPVVTDEMVEAAEDVDPTTVSTLQADSDERHVTLIARVDPSTSSVVGSEVILGIKAERLHFFDLDDGAAIN